MKATSLPPLGPLHSCNKAMRIYVSSHMAGAVCVRAVVGKTKQWHRKRVTTSFLVVI